VARLWTGGAEWGDTTAEGISGNAADIQTGTVRSGARAWRFNTAGHSVTFSFTGALGTGYYGRAYINITTPGSVAFDSIGFYTAGGAGYWVMLNTNSTLQLVFEATPGGSRTNIGSASDVLGAGWYRVELFAQIGSGGSDDSAELRLRSELSLLEELTRQDRQPHWGRSSVGDPSSLKRAAYSSSSNDGALTDSGGTAQNSWPGKRHARCF
jgi:hypothetical protein